MIARNAQIVRRSPGPRRRLGISMIELLIALAIAASLLTAVAIAIQGSFDSYKINQERAMGMQRARVALNRILAQIRTTQSHQPNSAAAQDDFVRGAVTTDSGISMFVDQSSGVSFQFTDGQLLRTPFSVVDGTITSGAAQVLLEGVQDFSITFESQASVEAKKQYGYGVYDQLRRATITLTLAGHTGPDSTGAQTLTLSCSVMPRRNMW